MFICLSVYHHVSYLITIADMGAECMSFCGTVALRQRRFWENKISCAYFHTFTVNFSIRMHLRRFACPFFELLHLHGRAATSVRIDVS
jgi:hypothetical protein